MKGATQKSGIDLIQLLQGLKMNREVGAQKSFAVAWAPSVVSVKKERSLYRERD